MRSADVINREGQGPIKAPPVFDEWAQMQREADRDDPYRDIPAAEPKQPPASVTQTYIAPAPPTAPIVPETPLVIAARKVETSRADYEAAKVALEQARAAYEAAQKRVDAAVDAERFAKKDLKDLVAASLGE